MDVSFIVTCYNYSKYVSDAINSCINQSKSKLSSEIIVVDDGSSDGSKEIIQLHFSDKVRFFSIENSGVERAANFGARNALGTYLVRLDADDILGEDYLKNVEKEICDLNLAKKTKNIDLIIGGHTHTFMNKPVQVTNLNGNDVLINQVGCFGINIGKIDFYLSGKEIKEESNSIKV